jgi:hypothetical protein
MNILLQHWTGELGELERLSSVNIANYAKRMGAEYGLLRGNVFKADLKPPCQKIYMLDKEFDAYETVVMVDMDMFAVRDLADDVFQLDGTGLFSEYTEKVFGWCRAKHPNLTDARFAYWGGAIYRLTLERRQELRKHLGGWVGEFNDTYHDEGIMHRLATLAKVKQDRIPDRWCQCSYLPNPESAAMIHIRTKIKPEGPKRTKLENYTALKSILE